MKLHEIAHISFFYKIKFTNLNFKHGIFHFSYDGRIYDKDNDLVPVSNQMMVQDGWAILFKEKKIESREEFNHLAREGFI